MFYVYLFSQNCLIRYDKLYMYRPITKSDRSNCSATNIDRSFQSILYSQLIYFTYIYLLEARTLPKCPNNLGELFLKTKEAFYFTKRIRRADQAHVQTLKRTATPRER